MLIALQNANCTTVGGELDFSEALTDGAEEPFGELGSEALDAVRVGFEERGGAVVHSAQGGLSIEIEGIGAGEADFDKAFAALHSVETGANEIAVEEDVAGSGEDTDIVERRLKKLSSAADGFEIELAGTLRADQGAFRGADDDVAGNFLEVDVALDAFERHVAHDLLDMKVNCVGELAGGDVHLGILRRLYFDAAIGDVVNHDDGPALHGKMLFEMITGSARGDTGAEKNYSAGDGQYAALNV